VLTPSACSRLQRSINESTESPLTAVVTVALDLLVLASNISAMLLQYLEFACQRLPTVGNVEEVATRRHTRRLSAMSGAPTAPPMSTGSRELTRCGLPTGFSRRRWVPLNAEASPSHIWRATWRSSANQPIAQRRW